MLLGLSIKDIICRLKIMQYKSEFHSVICKVIIWYKKKIPGDSIEGRGGMGGVAVLFKPRALPWAIMFPFDSAQGWLPRWGDYWTDKRIPGGGFSPGDSVSLSVFVVI